MIEETKIYNTGQFLFVEGEPANALFFINKGAVSICKNQGKENKEIGKAVINQIIGELSFFDKECRSETAVALTYVEARKISYDTLEAVYATVPPYMKAIMTSLATRLRIANELIHKLQKESK